MSTLSPNMNMPVSTIGVDTGLTWESNLNASLSILDSHNHTSGQGVPINPAGLNINSDLTINNNSLIDVKSIVITPVASLATLSAVYCIGPDLYFNDANGNAVQLTKNGSVNATSSGISSGTATASFSAGKLVVNSAPLTPANVQAGSYLLGNNVASSHFLTLSPPAAMAADFTLTLPNVPLSTLLMTLDASGNMGTVANATIADTLGQAMTSVGANAVVSTVNSAASANNIGSLMTSTGANAIAAARTRATGSTVAAGGVASSVVSSFSNTNPLFLSTMTSVTITTSGRPVMLLLTGVNSNSVPDLTVTWVPGTLTASTAVAAEFRISDGVSYGSRMSYSGFGINDTTATPKVFAESFSVPLGSVQAVAFVSAGTHTFTLSGGPILSGTGGTVTLTANNVTLVAYEL